MYKATLCGKIIGPRGSPLAPITKKNGYVVFNSKEGQTLVHRFVYEQLVGEIPDGLVVDHIDGNRSNNSVDNLQLLTQKENCRKGKQAKLTTNDLAEIQSLIGTKSNRQIAKQFGVSEQLICDIKTKRKY